MNSLRWCVTRDVLRRYVEAFRLAWCRRGEMKPIERLPHEAQFLPAVLALQETPISPAPRAAMWMLIAFAAVALLWASFGRIDVVATAQGRIVPSGRTKTLQPFETAVVTAIHVSDGQSVRVGEILIEFDATVARADESRIRNDLGAVRLQVARGQALLAVLARLSHPVTVNAEPYVSWQPIRPGCKAAIRREQHAGTTHISAHAAPEASFPERQHGLFSDGGDNCGITAVDAAGGEELARPAGVNDAVFAEARRLLAGQIAEYVAKLKRIEAEIARREAELRSIQELVGKLERTAPIARQLADDFKRLADRKAVASHVALEHEQVRIEQEADLASQRSRLNEIRAALRAIRGQRAELIAEASRITLDTITEGERQAAALEQELIKAETRTRLMRLTSPVEGTVQQLAVHTVGGVVTPAQPLMIIVPRDNSLEIEAQIDNKDIGFVRPNQPAEVKIETFPYTRYGTIPATVTSVSRDAMNDEQRGLVYSTRVRMAKPTINVDGAEVRLAPGMATSVEIKTGKRRVIEYFLSPLIQYARESFRER